MLYAAASALPQMAADWLSPVVPHCGFTNRGWSHSFMTMNSCTVGKVRATAVTHAANCAIFVGSPHELGFVEGAHFVPPVKACECNG